MMISTFSRFSVNTQIPVKTGMHFSGQPIPHRSDTDEFTDSFSTINMGLKRNKTSDSLTSIETTDSMKAYDRLGVRPEYLQQPGRANVPELTKEDRRRYLAYAEHGLLCTNGQPLQPHITYNYVINYKRQVFIFPRDKSQRDDNQSYQHCSVFPGVEPKYVIGAGEIRILVGRGLTKMLVSTGCGGYWPKRKHLDQTEDVFTHYYDLSGYNQIKYSVAL